MKRSAYILTINLGLLLAGSGMAFSGLLIQFNYHMGHHAGINPDIIVLGLNYQNWSDIHKITILVFSICMFFHTILHWKWYKMVIKKKLIAGNRQTILLSVLFLMVAITGYMPWLIKLTGGEEDIRKMLIEIHDKLTLVLFVFLILHVIKRLKWFLTMLEKLKADSRNNTMC
jgi:hypothetical protein